MVLNARHPYPFFPWEDRMRPAVLAEQNFGSRGDCEPKDDGKSDAKKGQELTQHTQDGP